MKAQFKFYLENFAEKSNGDKYAKNTINNYLSSITTLSGLLNRKFYLMEEDELAELPNYIKQIQKGGEMQELGDVNNGGTRAALPLYEKFRQDYQVNPEKYTKKIKKTKNEELVEEVIEETFASLEIFKDFKIIKRQFSSDKYKFDLLLEHKSKNEQMIVEIKDTPINSDSISQIANYINSQKVKFEGRVTGLIIGHSLTKSAKQFYSENITNCEIKFVKYSLNVKLEEVQSL